jgi:glutaredoxin
MPADIEVFSGPNCVHCEAAKQLLGETGLDFVERRVDDPDELAELRHRVPRAMALPQIFVDGEHIGNDDDLRIRSTDGRPPFGPG